MALGLPTLKLGVLSSYLVSFSSIVYLSGEELCSLSSLILCEWSGFPSGLCNSSLPVRSSPALVCGSILFSGFLGLLCTQERGRVV